MASSGRRPGRPPKPIERKRRTGNPGKRALPAISEVAGLPQATSVPDPVRPLGDAGLALWARVWNAAARWVSPDTDIEILQLLCEQIDERQALRLQLLRNPDPLERQGLRQLDAQIVTKLSLLGFTPSDRSRLGVAEVVAASTLEQMRAARGT